MKPIKNHLEKRVKLNYDREEISSDINVLKSPYYQIKDEFQESPKQKQKNKNIMDRYKDLEQTLNKKEKEEANNLL